MTASKTKRLLYFMSELEKGNDISKTDYLTRFGISERTLKEDVSELKENLTELRPNMKVKYSRKYGSYHAQYEQGYGNLKYNQAVILSKILLESRTLRKDEVAEIINIFVERAVDDKERRRIKRLTDDRNKLRTERCFTFTTNKQIYCRQILNRLHDKASFANPSSSCYYSLTGVVAER